jgi:integrase/recombinase XerD
VGIGKQAKILSSKQINIALNHLSLSRHPQRNRVIFLFSIKAGLRAKEIASLRWEMLLRADGTLSRSLSITNKASKGSSGREIPLNKALRELLEKFLLDEHRRKDFNPKDFIIRTQRSNQISAQSIINMFANWYNDLGMVGCSSHSGRRTFISNTARKISTVGGSLRDVQSLAGHTNLQSTQRYIEFDSEAQRRVVDLI